MFSVGIIMMVAIEVHMLKNEWRINQSFLETECTLTDKKMINLLVMEMSSINLLLM